MIEIIRSKIRALVKDLATTSTPPEVFSYTNSNEFILQQPNISNIITVRKNQVELGSGEWSYDSTTNRITISASLTSLDIIEVTYSYYKYSEAELNDTIKASLVWLSIFSYCSQTDYELEDDDIYPTPTNKTTDLIALISSILIKPDYTEYRLPNLVVRYDNKLSQEDRIEMLVAKFKYSPGIFDVIEFEE